MDDDENLNWFTKWNVLCIWITPYACHMMKSIAKYLIHVIDEVVDSLLEQHLVCIIPY